MKNFLIVVGAFVLAPLSIMWNGFVFAKLWLWFIVPQFGISPLSLPVAIGLMTMVRFCTYIYDYKKDDEDSTAEEKLQRAVLVGALSPMFILLLGYILTLFM